MKCIKYLFVLCILLTLAACGGNDGNNNPDNNKIPNPSTTNEQQPDCTMLRQAMIETTDIAAVAFLGYNENTSYTNLKSYLNEKNLLENHPFMKEIKKEQFVDTEGDELYCIVPLDPNAEVTVYEWIIDEYNNYEGEIGNVLYHHKTGTPIIVSGNISDMMPNMMIEIIDSNNRKIEYTPHMGLMDGYLAVPETEPTIFDFTEYNKVLPPQPFNLDILSDRKEWEVTFVSTNNELIEANFYFDEDRYMSMSYGTNSTSPEVYYEGNYGIDHYTDLPENAVYIYLEKTVDYSNKDYPDKIYTVLQFVQRDYDVFVYANYHSEDPLFANDQTKQFVFKY